jgi:alkylhydroperoxidase family enzyme
MRLAILEGKQGFLKRVMGGKKPDLVKTLEYRAEFFGDQMRELVHEVMRGESQWSVGDRELMAAFVSKTLDCEFGTKLHAAIAASVSGDRKVDIALANLDAAPIEDPLRATLAFLGKLTRDFKTIAAEDVKRLFEHGVSRVQIEDALSICFAFNVIARLADTFRFEVEDKQTLERNAKSMVDRGYV